MGGAAGSSAICPLAAGLCILGPVCLTGVSAGRTLGVDGTVAARSSVGCVSVSPGRTLGPVGLSGRTLGVGKLSGVVGVCWGAGLDAVEGGDGLEDTGPASGVAGGCCSGIPGAWVSGSLGWSCRSFIFCCSFFALVTALETPCFI